MIEFFVRPEDREPCNHAIEQLTKFGQTVRDLGSSTPKQMNGHSVILTPAKSSVRRAGRGKENHCIFVQYVAPVSGASTGSLLVAPPNAADRHPSRKIHAAHRLSHQVRTAIGNAERDLARRKA